MLRALLGRLKAAHVLGPWRGQPAADTDALVDLMVRLSHFAADHVDDISEIDLNPVIVHDHGQGLSIVDALILKRCLATDLLSAVDALRAGKRYLSPELSSR